MSARRTRRCRWFGCRWLPFYERITPHAEVMRRARCRRCDSLTAWPIRASDPTPEAEK